MRGLESLPVARRLRGNQTDAEQRVWSRLRRRQISGHYFRRQVPIAGYVVDFACLSESLIVEVDGGQHADRRTQDAKRTQRLEAEGYKVLRFWNNDVLANTDSVVETIERYLTDRQTETQVGT